MSRFCLIASLVTIVCANAGCTYRQLQRSTVGQSKTLEDIYQQQVLDNLAKFVQNPNAMPYFGLPSQGNSTVSDTTGATPSVNFIGDGGFSAAALGLSGQRNILLAWTLNPITDPRKLALMRCAYQKALAGAGIAPTATVCPNCDDRLEKFYTGHDVNCLNCLGAFFHCGQRKDVPRNCECLAVGHYCGTYVWVTPEGRDSLSKLTLAILDFAVFDPKPNPQAVKTVRLFLSNDMRSLTTRDKAVGEIVADVHQDAAMSEVTALLLNGKATPAGKQITPTLPRTKTFEPMGLFELQNRLRSLSPGSAFR